jgi:hypothetical protein
MFVIHDQIYERCANAEIFGDFGRLFSVVEHATDFGDISVTEFRFGPGVEAKTGGMLSIACRAGPFEVCHPVIGFNSIDMVDLRQVGWVRNECQSHEPVNQKSRAVSSNADDNAKISFATAARKAWSYYLSESSLGSSIFAYYDSVNATNSSEAADFVEFDKACDRNGSPFFGDDDIHVMGGPSGEFGSTIKNPSHAATFGGFAIMAAPSDTYKGRPICRLH